MNKTIVTLLTSILIVTSANAYEDIIRDGAIGAIMGAVIGNNMGSGDSETGAVIGGVSAIIFGEKGRSHRQPRIKNGCYTHTHTSCTCKVILHPVTKTVEIREQVWVPGRVIRNACGEVIYRESGRYETHSRFETITVYR
jgi:uncharacterized protein YcfJ